MNYFFKNLTFPVWLWHLDVTRVSPSTSDELCPKRYWQMQKICLSCKWVGGFAELSCIQATITAGKKKAQSSEEMLYCWTIKARGKQIHPHLDLISVISAAGFEHMFLFLKHLDTQRFCAHKHHSTTSNYSPTNHISAATFEMQIQTWVTSWVVCSEDEKMLQLREEILFFH